MHPQGSGKDLHPAMGHFGIRPLFCLIDINPDYNVVVVAHDRISAQIHSNYGAKQSDAVHDPLATVFEIEARMGIFATQEGPPDTAEDAVIVGCVVQGDLAVSGLRHVLSVECVSFVGQQRRGAVSGAGKTSLNVALSGVQASVRDGFSDVFGMDVFSLIKVGDGARHLEYAVAGTR